MHLFLPKFAREYCAGAIPQFIPDFVINSTLGSCCVRHVRGLWGRRVLWRWRGLVEMTTTLLFLDEPILVITA
jgi:hypothetical protein